MNERRYTEEEVKAIFARAAEAELEPAEGSSRLLRAPGRTLVELQAIGEEAGIPGELVARAARWLDRAGQATGRSFFGFPIAVGRTVELGRELSDDEWDRLVVDLRETFDARGRVRRDGRFRQWTNGNLHALLEPTETGHRLRLGTLKGDARAMMTTGIALLGIAMVMMLAFLLTGQIATDWDASLFLGLIGAGLFGAGALRLPRWAATRLRQMEEVAGRLTERVTSSDPGASPPEP